MIFGRKGQQALPAKRGGIKRRLRAAVPSVLFLSLTAYFAWNATRGELGLRAYTRRQGDLAAANAVLASSQAERDDWQNKVSALEPAHLDRDALDERAREMLNLALPDEIVVPTKN